MPETLELAPPSIDNLTGLTGDAITGNASSEHVAATISENTTAPPDATPEPTPTPRTRRRKSTEAPPTTTAPEPEPEPIDTQGPPAHYTSPDYLHALHNAFNHGVAAGVAMATTNKSAQPSCSVRESVHGLLALPEDVRNFYQAVLSAPSGTRSLLATALSE